MSPPKPKRPHWLGEVLVILGLVVVYDRVASFAKVRSGDAYDHGRDLLAVSPAGLEKTVNGWLADLGWLHDAAAYYYDLAHIDVTLALFLLCYVVRPGSYSRARTALVVINLIGLTVFFLYPVAPPRLLPDGGFVDIVANSGTWGAWENADGVAARANEFGAMPSLHLAWAVWVALTVMAMTSDRRWRTLGWVHVALTTVVVVATGNHYLIDVLAGAVVALTAWSVVARFTASSQGLPRESVDA